MFSLTDFTSKFLSKAISDAVTKTLKTLYPVGSYYISENATNPSGLFGFGTWELVKDRMLIGAGNSYSVGATGGEATHTLTVAEMPSHRHICNIFNTNNTNYPITFSGCLRLVPPSAGSTYRSYEWVTASSVSSSVVTTYGSAGGTSTEAIGDPCGLSSYTGSGTAHNNLPPYRAVYIYKRTA